MATDWNLIRKLMNSAIDACEKVDALDIKESERGATTSINGHDVTVWDFLQSAWTYPENSTYSVIRARHQLGDNKPYTPELARALQNTARLCSELIGAENLETPVNGANPHSQGEKSIRSLVSELEKWYIADFEVGVRSAIEKSRK